MKKLIFIIIFFSFFVTNAFSQNNPKLIQHVLSKHEIGKTFSFDLSNTSDGYLKVFITYLGTVSTLANKEYNIVTWGNVWGPNRHSDGVVYLFNTNDKY
ncbi:MAG: hypothetical protein JXL97_09920, partial [Bacteroidales bacterium]|nr:hypothetical protein [Bacteroidales bacterium]